MARTKAKAVEEMLEAAREIRRIFDAQTAYTRKLQELAAEARRTGQNLSHRIPQDPVVHDYGNGIFALLAALDKYEKAKS